MKFRQPALSQASRRRPSKLGQQLADEKIERARRQTPEERLAIALHLSDFCYETESVFSKEVAAFSHWHLDLYRCRLAECGKSSLTNILMTD